MNSENESMEDLYRTAMEDHEWCLRWNDNLRKMFFDRFDLENYPEVVKAHNKLLEKIREWETESPGPVKSPPYPQ